MIQDIFPHIFNNHYDEKVVAGPSDYVIITEEKSILVNKDDYEKHIISFPQVKDLCEGAELSYLFSIDELKYFTSLTKASSDNFCDTLPTALSPKASENFKFVTIRDLRNGSNGPKFQAFAAITGKHICDWYNDAVFCGRCGKKMKHSLTERAMKCSCGFTAYPRIMPAVIVGVLNGDKILVTKYNRGIAYNALIAGFTEIGETLEETVSREVFEEAGIHVKNIRYYKSQPWGVANDILMGFYCDLDGDDTITMDKTELKYAEWVSREDLELQPNDYSLTNEMMKKFKISK
jgi:NAD+ diphosphatase